MAIDGRRSIYDLTHRDSFQSPGKALDAEDINRLSDTILKIENWAVNAITVVKEEAHAPSLTFAVQRWLWSYQGTGNIGSCILNISPAILEDAGIISSLSDTTSNPLLSLAKDVSLTLPAYPIISNLPGSLGVTREIQPSWVSKIQSIPLLSFSIRLFGAVGTDVYQMENPVFFDAGNGITPLVQGNVAHSTPDKRLTAIPNSTFEICMILGNWTP